MKFNWKLLYKHLNDLRKECHESWRELGHQGGLPSSIFTRIKKGKPATVENLLKIMALFPKAKKKTISDFIED